MAKSIAERTTEIAGEEGASVRAIAAWVHIDPETRRPARLPADFHGTYEATASGHRPRSSLRHPDPPAEGAEELRWRFGRADLDIAGHVNNTMYWRLAEDLLRQPAGGFTAEAEYRAGIGTGEALVARAADMLWVSSPDGELAASLALRPRVST